VTIDAVRKRASEIRAEASLRGDPAGDRDKLKAVPTFASFVEDRYLPFAKERLRSYRDHESFYRLRLKARWGKRRIDEIKPHHVIELQDALRREGLSNATVNRYTAFVRRLFSLAGRWQLLEGSRNPAQHAEMRLEHHRETYLKEVEIRTLFKALGAEENKVAAGVIALLAATGARRGEAMAARWEHIDVDRRIWTVPVSKSGRRRHIPLSDGALLVLGRLSRVEGSPWVFPGRDGKQIGCVRKAWCRIKASAGLPADLRIHDLRHTFASMLVARGRSLQEVQLLLGHSGSAMTLRYAHLQPSQLIEAANHALPDFS
jgi:integrase